MCNESKAVIRTLFAILVAIQLILAGAWLLVDRTPPYWDEAWYLYQGAVQLDSLQKGDIGAWLAAWSSLDPTRPSLVSTLVTPFFAIFGISVTSGLLLNLVAWGVLLSLTYALGSAIHSPCAGLVSAIIVGSFPALIGLVHILLVELVMVTFVAATLLALWCSRGLQHKGWSLAVGLLTGLGFLTKVFFGVFLVGPWVVTLWCAWKSKPAGVALLRSCVAWNFAAAALLATATAALWYGPNLASFLRRSADAAVGTEAAAYGPANPWYWRNLLAYFFSFTGTVISPSGLLLLILALIGLLLAYRRRQDYVGSHDTATWTPLIFLASSFFPAYLVFTSIRNQDMKHITGVLPALAVLTGWGLVTLFRQRWKAAILLAGLVMIGQVVLGTFPGPLQDHSLAVTVAGQPLLLFYPAQSWNNDTRYAAPDPRSWPLRSVLEYAVSIQSLMPGAANPLRLGVAPDAPGVEEHALRFEATRRRVPVDILTAQQWNLHTIDILIHKTGDWGWSLRRAEIEKIMQTLAATESEFHPLPRTFDLPDGSEIVLFARVPSIWETSSATNGASVEFESAGRFVGYDYSVNGHTLNLTYHWETLTPTQGDFSVFVHLMDPQTGDIVMQDDHLLFERIYPTSTWQPGRRLVESRQITVPSEYSGASLVLRLGLYQGSTRLPVVSSANVSTGIDYADVGQINLPARQAHQMSWSLP